MDSFYDAPRRPPVHFSTDKLSGEPVVPEISILCSQNPNSQNNFIPYNQWKQQHNSAQNHNNKENVANNIPYCPQNNSILKKVRFRSPQLHQKQTLENSAEVARPFNNVGNQGAPRGPVTINPAKTGLPSFEQMYMANIPNRQLDLSVIDIPARTFSPPVRQSENNEFSEKKPEDLLTPKTYKEFLENQKKVEKVVLDDSVKDIFNYRGLSEPTNGNGVVQSSGSQSMDRRLDHIFFSNTSTNHIQHEYERHLPREVVQPAYFSAKVGLSSNVVDVDSHSNNKNMKSISSDNLMCSSNSRADMQEALSYGLPKADKHCLNEMYTQQLNYRNEEIQHRKRNSSPAKKCQCCTEMCGKATTALKRREEDDLSTKDLLKIIVQQSQQIAQQNTQLLLLQQQVSNLVSAQKTCESGNRKAIEEENGLDNDFLKNRLRQISHDDFVANWKKDGVREVVEERCVTSTQHNVGANNFFATPNMNKNQGPNFSIGLTTSVEVSFRRPFRSPGEVPQRNPNKVLNNYEPEPPKIQEITETESTKSECAGRVQNPNHKFGSDLKGTLVDTSMVFKEPIKVRETCPSPEPSIQIEMNDFEDSESEEEEDPSQIEMTFYRNLMAQVNKILRKAQIGTAEDFVNNGNSPNFNNDTIHKVKEVTLRHLRKIGVDVPGDESTRNSSLFDDEAGMSYSQDDVSFAVKQLLMKYLPAEHLAKLAAKNHHQNNQMVPSKEKIAPVKNRPEFSFATVQYMKKYNLIGSAPQKDFPQYQKQSFPESPKILDISKLKQQPKLL